MIKKDKLAYIDHWFKKKTKSSDFLKQLLSKKYNLTELWDFDINYLNQNKFDLIFFFQNIPSPKDLKKINCKNLIWCPMWDAQAGWSYFRWLRYRPFKIKIISFSKVLFHKVNRLGFDSIYLQYYIRPDFLDKNKTIKDNEVNIFFWNRVDKINWQTLKKIIGDNKINKIIFRDNPDPGHKSLLPSELDIKKYNIKIIKGWLEKNRYKELLFQSNVFIAPRPYEGIGMSFLEALTSGMCVIAPDNSVMNEYIVSGENGYLYNLKSPKEIDLSNLNKIKENARNSAIKGYYKWEQEKYKILEFIK